MPHTPGAFEALAGEVLEFYGVCGTLFKLGETVWEAIEDESDGYRSYLDSIVAKDPDAATFFSAPIAQVKVQPVNIDYELEGFHLVDSVDGHLWLQVGTHNFDDYYPCFRFWYTPKAAETVGEETVEEPRP